MEEVELSLVESHGYAIGEFTKSCKFNPFISYENLKNMKNDWDKYFKCKRGEIFLGMKIDSRKKWKDADIMLLPID